MAKSATAPPVITEAGTLAHDEVASRERRLVRVLGRARQGSQLVLTEQWLFVIGAALAVTGIILVIIGWVGASQTILVAGQIPYVISGGLLGVTFVILGGFLYFGHWLALLVREGRERGEVAHDDAARLESTLLDLREALLQVGAVAPAQAARLVRTPSGSMVHRADCLTVAGRDDLQEVAAVGRLRPCAICAPT